MLEYENRIQELVRTHEEESFQMKQKHNDKVDELLQRINEINTRYNTISNIDNKTVYFNILMNF